MRFGDYQADLARQVRHWQLATHRLRDFDLVASKNAWQSLEHYLGVSLRQALDASVERVSRMAERLMMRVSGAADEQSLAAARDELIALRQAYLRVETSVEFYADALATRSMPKLAPFLRACDHLATRSMAEILVPLGRQVPAVLSYTDGGIGASILRAGLRLWDGTTDNPVAAIKIVRHALFYRPTSLLHEAGHQVAHMLDWNTQFAQALAQEIAPRDRHVAEIWAGWASEITADVFAFAHAGYAAVVALHDVLEGPSDGVFRFLPGDPHPIAYLRMLLNIAMAQRSFGDGPWDRMRTSWLAHHPITAAPSGIRQFVEASVRVLPVIVDLALHARYRAFGDRPIVALINPARVAPAALEQLAREAGAAMYTSPYWAWNEAIRILALNGYRASVDLAARTEAAVNQEQWMMRLGAMRHAA